DPFVPVETQPAEAVEDVLFELGGRTNRVGVVDADDEDPSGVSGIEPVVEGSAGRAYVQVPGRRRCHSDSHGHRDAPTRRFASTPIPSISTSIRSPISTGPTPAGVPVRTTSPGRSVITLVMNWRISATPNTMSTLNPAWRTSPLTRQMIASRSSGSSSVSIAGPSGQKVSKPFARVHCPSLRCRSRAVTSLAAVYPKMY